MNIKAWVDRRLGSGIQAEQINASNSHSHSRAYHRFFAGYTEVKKGRQGRLGHTIERIYTGQYHRYLMGRKKGYALQVLYACTVCAAAALFASAAVAPIEINNAWYVVLPQAVSIVALVWTCTGIGNALLAPKNMTVYEFASSSGRIKKGSIVTSTAMLFTTLMSALWLILHKGEDVPISGVAHCIAKLVLSCALLLALNRAECMVKYEKFVSEMNGKVNGVEIK